jgi:hypothetical protein
LLLPGTLETARSGGPLPRRFGTDSKVSLPLCESFGESGTTVNVLRFVATKWKRRDRVSWAQPSTPISDYQARRGRRWT